MRRSGLDHCGSHAQTTACHGPWLGRCHQGHWRGSRAAVPPWEVEADGPYPALGHTGQGLAVTQARFPHLCALTRPRTPLHCRTKVHSSLHSSEMKDGDTDSLPRQAVSKDKDPAFFPFLLPPEGQFLLLISQDLLFPPTADRNRTEDNSDIDLYGGISTTVLENPLLLHHLILFGVIKPPLAKRQNRNVN